MDPRELVLHLESLYTQHSVAQPTAKQIVLAGLQWPGAYWLGLAVSWLEQGAPIDTEIANLLSLISGNDKMSQKLRHRAFALARRHLSRLRMEELDVVKVVRLREPARPFTGTDEVDREPRVGDKGTIVHVYPPLKPETAYIVEAVNSEGYTLWVADFVASELQLHWKFQAKLDAI